MTGPTTDQRVVQNRAPAKDSTPRLAENPASGRTSSLGIGGKRLSSPTTTADLHISLSSTEKHINAIFDKLGLAHSTGLSRRVVAVVTYLGGSA